MSNTQNTTTGSNGGFEKNKVFTTSPTTTTSGNFFADVVTGESALATRLINGVAEGFTVVNTFCCKVGTVDTPALYTIIFVK